ncbi:MAG: ribonuclease HII [Zoogloeaceae bacterium]|jgi:ribonuclease HII|nr:ribonuclease HII [Zoogloeaceae bacterium]
MPVELTLLPSDVCGIDEAGRGPLAGAVVAAAVILDPQRPIAGLNDSKKLSARRREQLAALIRAQALAWAVAEASVTEIDAINILQASFLAMQRAVAALKIAPVAAVVDGNRCPKLSIPVSAVVKGDGKIAAIAAASILAKTVRDARMLDLHQRYPQYGFNRHMGYPTAAHLAALQKHGPCPAHRKSFAPVAILLARQGTDVREQEPGKAAALRTQPGLFLL